MIIKKVALGNKHEAFIEERFTDGFNIISSNDNNKGKTILIQAMMYAIGNNPTFPSSFRYQDYIYYIEFEESGTLYQLARYKESFTLKFEDKFLLIDGLGELRTYWSRNIFSLPEIMTNGFKSLVYLELFVQLFFVPQDETTTSNIMKKGFYNKENFLDMLYSIQGLKGNSLSIEKQEELKKEIAKLKEQRKLLLKEKKILKSKAPAVSMLNSVNEKETFAKKIIEIEATTSKINKLSIEKNKASFEIHTWENFKKELQSINKNIVHGKLTCSDCNSSNITYHSSSKSKFAFDVSTAAMRKQILISIDEKIAVYKEKLARSTADLVALQNKLNNLLNDDTVTLESLIMYKDEVLDASEVTEKILEIDMKIEDLSYGLDKSNKSLQNDKEAKELFMKKTIEIMHDAFIKIDPKGNNIIEGLFTKSNETFSGSEEKAFYTARLYALQKQLNHNFPIIIDSFRDDLSTIREDSIIELLSTIPNQKILTTTLKIEEENKYSINPQINHIDYSQHTASKILSIEFFDKFQALLKDISITVEEVL